MAKSIFPIIVLTVLAILLVSANAAGSNSKKTFHEGRRLIHNGKFDQGRQELQKFLNDVPRHEFASRALFLIGKSYLGNDQTKKAKETFHEVIRQHPQSLEAGKAAYKLVWIKYVKNGKDAALALANDLIGTRANPYRPEIEYLRSHGK